MPNDRHEFGNPYRDKLLRSAEMFGIGKERASERVRARQAIISITNRSTGHRTTERVYPENAGASVSAFKSLSLPIQLAASSRVNRFDCDE